MTEAEKIAMVKAMSGETDEDTVSAYLYLAGQKICRAAYPYDASVTIVPAQYDHVQVEAAVYLLNKRGSEGQVGHNENGVNRTYESADLPYDLIGQVVPVCGVSK